MAITTVSIKLGDKTYPLTLVNGAWTAELPADGVQPGITYAEFTATNDAGYQTKEYKKLEILPERTPPVVAITSPTEDSWNSSYRQPIVFDATDNVGGSGVNPDSIVLTIDGETKENANISSVEIENGYTFTYTPPSDLSEGGHNATVQISDYAGNVSNVASVQYNIDVNAPDLSLTSPPVDYYTNKSTVDVIGTAVDYGVGLKSVTINDQEVTVGEDGSFSLTVDISEGRNIIRVVATDLLDKSVTIERNVVVDTTAPEIVSVEIEPFMDGFPFWEKFLVTVTLKDPGEFAAKETVEVKCNKEDVVFTETETNVWKGYVTHSDGYNLEITAFDAAGNRTSEAVYFDNGFGLRWDWTVDDYLNYWDMNRIQFVTSYLRRWLEERGYLAGNLPIKYDWNEVDIPNRTKVDEARKNVDALKFANFKDWREILYLNIVNDEQMNAIEWDLRLLDLWLMLSEKNNIPALALQQTLAALRGLPACEVIVAPRERMEQPVAFGEEEASCSLSG